MAIVSISRGSSSYGAEVAERVARTLGYRCLAREAVLEAAGLCSVPTDELEWALDQPPSFFSRSVASKERYVGAIEATLLYRFSQDNVVYHGFAGHYFTRNIEHALKVRILAEMSDRLAVVTARDHLSERKARRQLRKTDRARRQWGLYLYGMDPEDPSLYDIILHVGKMGADGAAEIICTLLRNETFITTETACRKMGDLALIASVRVALMDLALDIDIIEVTANDGVVCVGVRELGFAKMNAGNMERARHIRSLRRRAQALTRKVPGLKKLTMEHCAK